ncbi:MAG: SWIB/MDM2 domain-containing protein [Pseudobdellovibrionaceae bacterium]|nr:SWIB/MDM2 domain-containing protein [Pseudobdellovibrionaceae bacterium]
MAAKKKKTKKKAVAKKTTTKKKTTRKPNPAFMKALKPSEALAAIIGKGPFPRTEVTKRIWDYIKKNKLQDQVNKRIINADQKLRELFGQAKVNMFEMTKIISKHLSE